MSDPKKFDRTDRLMMIGSAIGVSVMLVVTHHVADSMRLERAKLAASERRLPASVTDIASNAEEDLDPTDAVGKLPETDLESAASVLPIGN